MTLEGKVVQVIARMKDGKAVKVVRIMLKGCEAANDTLDIITPEGFELGDEVTALIQN